MTIHNMEVAEQFNRLADLLEIDGANPFRVRAYRNAARIVSGMGKNIADLVSEDEDLTKFPGIGKDLAEKIKIHRLFGFRRTFTGRIFWDYFSRKCANRFSHALRQTRRHDYPLSCS